MPVRLSGAGGEVFFILVGFPSVILKHFSRVEKFSKNSFCLVKARNNLEALRRIDK